MRVTTTTTAEFQKDLKEFNQPLCPDNQTHRIAMIALYTISTALFYKANIPIAVLYLGASTSFLICYEILRGVEDMNRKVSKN